MSDERTLPMLDEREPNPASAALLASAERIVHEECCANGCAVYDDAMGDSPLVCTSFAPSLRAPLECTGFRCDAAGVELPACEPMTVGEMVYGSDHLTGLPDFGFGAPIMCGIDYAGDPDKTAGAVCQHPANSPAIRTELRVVKDLMDAIESGEACATVAKNK
ncbi:hypothetical protein [Eggerthella timonensis]|uniref:hypothetical protein n=1 Tax=Eggerthella timonensis TaxID=1871008 RepID=UPI000C766F92|nr:hypothetical protein [Eggerthella timonensis]